MGELMTISNLMMTGLIGSSLIAYAVAGVAGVACWRDRHGA